MFELKRRHTPFLISNPFHIFSEHNLLPAIIELSCPAVRMIGNVLRCLKRSTFFKKAG